MECHVFIHGSSVGQSSFIPSDAPEIICNDIAGKYFQGRTLRYKESAAQTALFIDIYKSPSGTFCIYSFVNNACRGANGRDGQYFALSILCKGVYVYPEIVYDMLRSAYSAMFQTKKILTTNEKGEVQYVVSQFKEQNEYLIAFLKKIENTFAGIASNEGKLLKGEMATADYDSWKGNKTYLDICNSLATYKALATTGRLYISEEYESPSEKINTLEKQLMALKVENSEIRQKYSTLGITTKSKVQGELDQLNETIRKKDVEIEKLKSENAGYEESIGIVKHELEKYAKAGKALTDLQNSKNKAKSKSRMDILKLCLLFVILLLTLISALANYGFFRDFSPLTSQKTSETKDAVSNFTGQSKITEYKSSTDPDTMAAISSGHTELLVNSTGGNETLHIPGVKSWEEPVISGADWITCKKTQDSILSVYVSPNSGREREFTFVVTAGSFEKQITVKQKGQDQPQTDNFSIVATDYNGNAIKPGATVKNGEIISARVIGIINRPGYGWTSYNCSLDNGGRNTETVNVTIDRKRNASYAVFSYGDLSDDKKRLKFLVNIRESPFDADNSIQVSPSEAQYE